MSESSETVCVTGASGYIASWLIKLLLHRGYSVRASVRNPSDLKKTEHLYALEGASERLQLFKGDLLVENSFDSVIEGCNAVFHLASPVKSTATDPQAELIDPAVKGTLNVLKSCAKSRSIERVVLTSSINAVTHNGETPNPNSMVDESWFSSPEFCERSKLWYHLSKTLAEKAAWEFSKEHKIDLVVINPGFVIGPILQPILNATSEIILNLISGSTTFPNALLRGVNVKDVAMAHILAYENPSANGRYLLVESVNHFSDVVKIIRNHYPSIPLPDKCENDKPFLEIYKVSKEKAQFLGINFISFEIGIKEIIESLKDKGFVTF